MTTGEEPAPQLLATLGGNHRRQRVLRLRCRGGRALQHFRAVNAGGQRAKLLSIREDAALVHVTRISYLADGRVVEVTQTFCRSDYYDFVVELRR